MFACPAISHLCEEGKQLLANSCSLPSERSGSEGSPHGRIMRLLTDHYSQSRHVEGLTAEPVINKVEAETDWQEIRNHFWERSRRPVVGSSTVMEQSCCCSLMGNKCSWRSCWEQCSSTAAAHLLSWVASSLFPKALTSARKSNLVTWTLWGKTHVFVSVSPFTKDAGEVRMIWQLLVVKKTGKGNKKKVNDRHRWSILTAECVLLENSGCQLVLSCKPLYCPDCCLVKTWPGINCKATALKCSQFPHTVVSFCLDLALFETRLVGRKRWQWLSQTHHQNAIPWTFHQELPTSHKNKKYYHIVCMCVCCHWGSHKDRRRLKMKLKKNTCIVLNTTGNQMLFFCFFLWG